MTEAALSPFLGFDIEVSAPCNARCSFCPQNWHGVKRGRPYLAPELLTKIVDQIAGLLAAQRARHQNATSTIGFCGMGEPLLRKDLVLHALSRLATHGPLGSNLLLVTNGTYLSEDFVSHELFAMFSQVVVSMTGWGASYESIYGTDFEQVKANVLMAHGHYPGVVKISSVGAPEVPEADRREARRFFEAAGIEVGVPNLHSRGGHYTHPAAYPGRTRPFAGCSIFGSMNFISSDGEVLSCCHDVVSDNVMGDLNEEDLLSIIARKQAIQREAVGFAICRSCTDFSLLLPEEKRALAGEVQARASYDASAEIRVTRSKSSL